MRPKLVLIAGKADKAEIRLKLPTIVGRTHDAGLMIAHKTVSRRHCELFERHGMLFVRDTGSRNGTLVDSAPIKKEAMVKPGHTLTIGPLTFRADYEPADSFIHSDEPVPTQANGATAPRMTTGSATTAMPSVSEEPTRDIGSAEEASPAKITQSTKPSDTPGELEFEEFSAEDLAELDMPAAHADSDGDLAAPLENEESAPVEAAAAGGDEVMSLDDDLGMEFNLDDLADAPAEEAPAAEADDMLSFEAVEDVPAATEDALPGLGADDELAAFDLSDEPAAPAAKAEAGKAADPLDGLLDDVGAEFDLNDLAEPAAAEEDAGDDLGFTLEDLEETPAEEPAVQAAAVEEEDDAMTFDLAGDASAPEPPATPAKKPAKDAGKVPLGEEKPSGGESDMSSFMKELGL